jgi:hypothetical protein
MGLELIISGNSTGRLTGRMFFLGFCFNPLIKVVSASVFCAIELEQKPNTMKIIARNLLNIGQRKTKKNSFNRFFSFFWTF